MLYFGDKNLRNIFTLLFKNAALFCQNRQLAFEKILLGGAIFFLGGVDKLLQMKPKEPSQLFWGVIKKLYKRGKELVLFTTPLRLGRCPSPNLCQRRLCDRRGQQG